jgi:hypothetical protein
MLVDELNNTIKSLWESSYIGKIDNNDYGRKLFNADCISVMKKMESMQALQNFDSSKDISIYAGEAIDSVVAEYAAQPVDSMEKLYGTVMVG